MFAEKYGIYASARVVRSRQEVICGSEAETGSMGALLLKPGAEAGGYSGGSSTKSSSSGYVI